MSFFSMRERQLAALSNRSGSTWMKSKFSSLFSPELYRFNPRSLAFFVKLCLLSVSRRLLKQFCKLRPLPLSRGPLMFFCKPCPLPFDRLHILQLQSAHLFKFLQVDALRLAHKDFI